MNQKNLALRETYRTGEIIDYKVKKRFTTYCELTDEKNITAYLQGTEKLVLFIGQTVKCRVVAVGEKHPKIELVDIRAFEPSKDNLTEEKLTALLATRELSREFSLNTKEFVRLMLTEEKEESFESQHHRWIRSLLNRKTDLGTIRQDCADLLELSDFLNICSRNERAFYQERLTRLIEQLDCYIKAEQLLDGGAAGQGGTTAGQFIDTLFSKLRISGYVFHPVQNFNTLACLFMRKPELMNSRMKELLDIIIHKDDLQAWAREPFGSALIKLLELYISECDGKIDKTKDNRDLIDTNMLALAVQLQLMKDSPDGGIADYRVNVARLCVVSSYLYPLDPARLVDAAYYYLFHSAAKLPSYKIEEVGKWPYYISAAPCDDIDTVNTFAHRNGRLVVAEGRIHLQSAGETASLYPVFPKSLGLWKDLQVFLTFRTETNLAAAKPNDITPYQAVWNEIESEFLNARKQPAPTVTKSRKRHRVYDSVLISFISQDENDRNKYYCQIEDETGGNGFIRTEDIVGYSISTSLRHFYASDGSRLVFQAQIVDKKDDQFHFSMLEDLKKFAADGYYWDDEDIICSVGSAPNNKGMAPAVTKEGVSVTIRNAGDFDGIAKNTIVRCRLIGPGTGTFHITCDIVDTDYYDFDLNTAFKNLMDDYSQGRISEEMTQQEQDQMQQSDKLIDETYVKGVIHMIDRMALIDTEYVKSYNYLGFARILCLLIGWESQAAYYKGRMDIIAMLHYFAQNSRLDEQELERLENANAELFSNNVVLRENFMQLQIASYIGRNEHNADLFALAAANPALKNLASLVLAYNITRENSLESSATDIHNQIFRLLNLRGYETGLKLYGTGEETEEVEYKTSLVFCAEDGSALPNPERQMEEILKVIDSFFNTRGGTLYVGVNNSGLGVGVENDLKTPIYYGDKEKYVRSLVDAVAIEWGNDIASTYLRHVGFDDENTAKDVLIVQILPIPSGLPCRGDWWVRKAGTKRKLTQKEFAEYHKVGRRLAAQTVAEPAADDPQTAQPAATVAPTRPLVTLKDDEIRTSRIRKNVLEEYTDPDNYVEPIGCFKFISGGKFKKIPKYDYDPDSLLTLAVKDGDERGYLVLGYENGCIVKTPVKELLKNSSQEYSRNTAHKLIFASIADAADAVLTIALEDKARPKTVMRLDHLERFDEGKLMDGGQQPCNEGLTARALAFDVIPEEHISAFTGILDKPKKLAGYPQNTVTQDMVDQLRQWGINEI